MLQACLYSADSKILSPLRNFPASSALSRGESVKVRSRWPFTVPGYRAMGLQTSVAPLAGHLSSSDFVT